MSSGVGRPMFLRFVFRDPKRLGLSAVDVGEAVLTRASSPTVSSCPVFSITSASLASAATARPRHCGVSLTPR
jgi:hypothetical protein